MTIARLGTLNRFFCNARKRMLSISSLDDIVYGLRAPSAAIASGPPARPRRA